jgi:hypothetical protein
MIAGSKHWFLDGKNSENNNIANPNTGYELNIFFI